MGKDDERGHLGGLAIQVGADGGKIAASQETTNRALDLLNMVLSKKQVQGVVAAATADRLASLVANAGDGLTEFDVVMVRRILGRSAARDLKRLLTEREAQRLRAEVTPIVGQRPAAHDASRTSEIKERILDRAEYVDDETVRQHLAWLLASEEARPGSFSPRTIDCLINLTRTEAANFAKPCRLRHRGTAGWGSMVLPPGCQERSSPS